MPISYGLTNTFRLGSVFATLSVTLERFFAIVVPLKDFYCVKRWLVPLTVVAPGNNFPISHIRVLYKQIVDFI